MPPPVEPFQKNRPSVTRCWKSDLAADEQ